MDFAALAQKEYALAVLPVHGCADYGADRPLDVEEVLGGHLLRAPWRGSKRGSWCGCFRRCGLCRRRNPAGYFGVGFDTACELLREIAAGVKAAGFHKLVFLNTSAANEPIVATVALEVRSGLGLRAYVIHTRSLGLDLSRHQAGDLDPFVDHVAGLLEEIRAGTSPHPWPRPPDRHRPRPRWNRPPIPLIVPGIFRRSPPRNWPPWQRP